MINPTTLKKIAVALAMLAALITKTWSNHSQSKQPPQLCFYEALCLKDFVFYPTAKGLWWLADLETPDGMFPLSLEAQFEHRSYNLWLKKIHHTKVHPRKTYAGPYEIKYKRITKAKRNQLWYYADSEQLPYLRIEVIDRRSNQRWWQDVELSHPLNVEDCNTRFFSPEDPMAETCQRVLTSGLINVPLFN